LRNATVAQIAVVDIAIRWVKSTQGCKSTFGFELPSAGSNSVNEQAAMEISGGGGFFVLVCTPPEGGSEHAFDSVEPTRRFEREARSCQSPN